MALRGRLKVGLILSRPVRASSPTPGARSRAASATPPAPARQRPEPTCHPRPWGSHCVPERIVNFPTCSTPGLPFSHCGDSCSGLGGGWGGRTTSRRSLSPEFQFTSCYPDHLAAPRFKPLPQSQRGARSGERTKPEGEISEQGWVPGCLRWHAVLRQQCGCWVVLGQQCQAAGVAGQGPGDGVQLAGRQGGRTPDLAWPSGACGVLHSLCSWWASLWCLGLGLHRGKKVVVRAPTCALPMCLLVAHSPA